MQSFIIQPKQKIGLQPLGLKKINKHIPQHMEEGLFRNRNKKQNVIEHLKKGTLFKLSNKLPKQVKIEQKDPYLQWLEQNSSFQSEHKQQNNKITMGETYFYLNTFDLIKQKKFIKTVLPKVQNFRNFSKSNSPFIKKQAQGKINVKVKDRETYYSNSNKHKLPLNNITKLDNCSLGKKKCQNNHKTQCYEHQLSKTQLFSPKKGSMSSSLYIEKDQQKENHYFRNNSYLQSHKKQFYKNQTFYHNNHKNINQVGDIDLKRIKGLGNTKLNSLQQNLLKLQEKGSISCYNTLSTYFGNFSNQSKTFLNRLKSTQKYYGNTISIQKGQGNNIRKLTEEEKNKDQSFLPQFLMKNIINSPPKRQKMSKSLQKLRV